ncbi:MAG: threonine/serine dehydratase [Cyanobacteria bacterium P01_D01_bin.105]
MSDAPYVALPNAAITKADIERAAQRISAYIRRTPIFRVPAGDCYARDRYSDGCSASSSPASSSVINNATLNTSSVALKLEYLQCAGSFKARGAFHNLLSRAVPQAGVVAASGGNHGVAVALAARTLGVAAHIFVPTISSPTKQQRIKQLGAKLIVGGDRYADALAASVEFAKESGAIAIHAYNTSETLAGAGTTALELMQQAPNIDTVLVAVGGGGLIGGMAAYLEEDVKVVAVETQGTPALHSALEAGYPVPVETSGIATDSLGASQVGSLCFPLIQRFVNESVLVSDDAVRQAQSLLWQNFRIPSEAGGAAAFAALSSGAYQPAPDEKVAVLVCGANGVIADYANS